MYHLIFVLLFLLVFLTNIYWAMIYKDTEQKNNNNSEQTDKLTYRRQFQRNAWNVPFVGILLLFIHSMDVFTSSQYTTVVLLFLIILVIQSIYTYRKWKSKEST